MESHCSGQRVVNIYHHLSLMSCNISKCVALFIITHRSLEMQYCCNLNLRLEWGWSFLNHQACNYCKEE